MKVTAIIPALNEEQRIGDVLKCVSESSSVDEILVVSDGSTDGTAQVAAQMPGVRVIELPENIGKAGAMRVGADNTDADILIFLDADLIGLKTRHINELVRPLRDASAEMSVGVFRGGRFWTDLAQKIAPVISGQRAIRRDLFLGIPELEDLRMGVEIALTKWARYNDIRVETVVIDGVTHPMKEEKLGLMKGFSARLAMYRDIVRVMLDGHKLRGAVRRKPVQEPERPEKTSEALSD